MRKRHIDCGWLGAELSPQPESSERSTPAHEAGAPLKRTYCQRREVTDSEFGERFALDSVDDL
jgi:hypothetical protein